jgi:nucleoid-associated protein YgaU
MTSGTKVFLAIFALLIGVLVLYYGVWQKAQPLGPASANAAGPAPSSVEPKPAPGKIVTHRNTDGVGSLRGQSTPTSPAQGTGWLTQSVQSNTGGSPPAADASLDSLASTPFIPPASAPAANTPLAIDSASQALTSNASPTGVDVGGESAQSTAATNRPGSTPPTSPQSASMIEYTIKAGDTGVSIAKEWFGDGNKWTLISKANPWADFNRLKIGQKIKLPPKDSTTASISNSSPVTNATTASKPVTMGDKSIYTVQAGDTLIKIARKHYGTDAKWEAIYEANKSIIGSDPANLKLGMKLTLPPKKS